MVGLIPNPPLHVCVRRFGFARLSSNGKCFLLAISDLKMAEVQEDDSSKHKAASDKSQTSKLHLR